MVVYFVSMFCDIIYDGLSLYSHIHVGKGPMKAACNPTGDRNDR